MPLGTMDRWYGPGRERLRGDQMKIAVLLSGGVDSSVALGLLRKEGGHELRAYYLKIWLEQELAHLGDCPWEEDLEYARATCRKFDVPLEVLPMQAAYRQQVVAHTLRELRAGRTPSPDILCNQRIKFGKFVATAARGFDKVASGHYAQVAEHNGRYLLKRAPDQVKDQTYFLSDLSQEQLRQALFPIGHLRKPQVRALAREFGLPTAERKDSQGICFLGKIKYREFVAFHLGQREGDIVEHDTGRILGKHAGYWFFTIGQRQGLGLNKGPWFVVRKDVESNTVLVSHHSKLEGCARRAFTISQMHWITPPGQTRHLSVKIRHTAHLEACRLETLSDAPAPQYQVWLSKADPGVAPGQSAVLYDKQVCLGGGRIE